MLKDNICCIIITYNIGENFYKCYNAIKNQVNNIIIVDNGSDADTIEVLKKINEDKRTDIIFNNENKGIAKALNIGIKVALERKHKWIMTLDNDSVATKNMVEAMIRTYNNLVGDEKVSIVSIAPEFIEEAYNDTENVNESDITRLDYEYQSLVITSGNLIRCDMFEKIGFFKEEYFIDSVDHEYCLRILKYGKRIIKVKNALLKHKIGDGIQKKLIFKTLHSSNHSALRRYYITRNSLDLQSNFKYMDVKYINETKVMLVKMAIKIFLVEKEKIKKLKYMIYGLNDYKKKKFGKFNGR